MDLPRTRRGARFAPALAAATLLVGLGVATIAFARLRAAPPELDAATTLVGTVERGDLVREVLGHGVLVPEALQWVVAVTPARVRKVLVRAGAPVDPDDVLVELDNADLELAALDADRQLGAAETERAGQEIALENQRLTSEASVFGLRGDLAQASRRDAVSEALATSGVLSRLDRDDARDKSQSLAARLESETKRLELLSRGAKDLSAAERAQIERLRAIARFRRAELAALHVVAGARGVVHEMPIEPGQWVVPGAVIAKIAKPGELKAEIRVPETLAKDVEVGQAVRIDTHAAIARGRVARVDPAVRGGTIRVDVVFDGPPPDGARPDQSVDGVVEVERAKAVLRVPRPALAIAGRTASLFKLDPRSNEARRVSVELGRASLDAIEIKGGCVEGDRLVLSETTSLDGVDRIRLR